MGRGRWKGGGEKDGPAMGRPRQDREDEQMETGALKRKQRGKAEVVGGEIEGARQG